MRILQNIGASTLLLATLLTLFPTPKAQAQLFVHDPAVFTVVSTIAGAEIAERTKEDLLDGLAWMVAKVAVQSMTRSIVNWINSGYEGSPAFSQNLNRDLRQVSDAIAGAFLTDFFEANIDTPFVSQARAAVSVYYLMSSGDALEQRLKYTLAGYARRSTDFIRGDWSGGGLSGLYGLTFRCENDPNCASLLIQEKLIVSIDAHAQKLLHEFNAGRGFLSWQGKCHDDASVSSGKNKSTSLSDEKKCAKYDVVTPGSVVEQTLVDSLGSGVRQLELADSINEIVSAVVMQMVGQVLGGGGLAGLSTPSASGGTRPIDQATDPTGYATSLNAGFLRQVETERSRALATKAFWLDIQAVALLAKDVCPVAGGLFGIVRSQEIQETLDRAVAAIARTDVAIAELDIILSLVEDSEGDELSSGNRALASQRAYAAYQAFMASGRSINEAERDEAEQERDEDNQNSLYAKMKNHASDCD